jgi:hypothetical protein
MENNNGNTKAISPDSVYFREQYLYNIFLSDKCGRFEDVLNGFESMIRKYGCNLNKNERNLFEKNIKQLIQNRQKKLNKLYNLEKEAKKQSSEEQEIQEEISTMINCLKDEKLYLEGEIKSICKRVIKLIDNYLIKNLNANNYNSNSNLEDCPLNLTITDKECEVYLYRLKADLYKYLSQVEKEDEYEKYLKYADNYFSEAIKIAKKNLDLFNVVNLATVIAYSKFLQNFKKDENSALSILIEIYKLKKAKDYLDGSLSADSELLGCLNEIKVMINNISKE